MIQVMEQLTPADRICSRCIMDTTDPEDLMRKDLDYALKKLNLATQQFEALVKASNKTFENYRNSRALFEISKKFLNRQRRTIG